MDRRQRIDLLLNFVETIQHPTVKKEYNGAVASRSVPRFLPIYIKNLAENLRSALDYLAQEIWDAYSDHAAKRPRIYFPIRRTLKEFEKATTSLYPRLASENPDLFRFLKAIQPFPGSGEEWMGDFNTLNNANKHFDLAPQVARSAPMAASLAGNLGPVVMDDQSTSEWVEFRFSGIDRNAHMLIEQAVVGVRYICDEVLVYLP